MGVKGLMTFLTRQNKSRYFKPYALMNQTIVFDGPNIAHFLIGSSTDIDLQFSGDNDIYYTQVKEYFEDFLHCGITPVVVMMGAFSEIDVPKAVQDGIMDNRHCQETRRVRQPMIFKTDIFLQVMRDLNLEHYRGEGDSHKEVAKLAQKLNCLVISWDSDFFIYDVKMIPSDLIYLKDCRKNNYINAYVFDRDCFLKMNNLESSALPVVATAIGNDFTETELSQYFYNQAGLPCNFRNYVDISAAMSLFKGLSAELAAHNYLRYFKSPEMNKQARMALKKSFEYYDTGFEDNNRDMITATDRIKNLLKTGEITASIAGLVRRNDFHFPVGLLEDLTRPSTADLCWDLLAGIYTFLQRQNEMKLKMTVYFRNGSQVAGREMVVNESLGITPGDMSVPERQTVFYKAADLDRNDITVTKLFPRSWQLFMAALLFWSKKMRAFSDFRSYHFHAVFLNVFVVNARRKASSKNESLVMNDSDGDISACKIVPSQLINIGKRDWEDLLPLYYRLRIALPADGRGQERIREACDTHFERCLVVIMELLNALSLVLGTTFKPIRYEKFMNGSVVYSLMQHLKSSNRVTESALDLLTPSTKIRNFYEFLCCILQSYVPQEDN